MKTWKEKSDREWRNGVKRAFAKKEKSQFLVLLNINFIYRKNERRKETL
jgi:hypothetical protein